MHKFRNNEVFVPQVLISAKAMDSAMKHLKPYFSSGSEVRKGTFIIGTVKGDLHDIGKNLVAMMVEGNGYKVIDLGIDVNAEKFNEAARKYPGSVIGLSTLLKNILHEEGSRRRIAVIQNEYAPTGVDGQELKREFPDFKLVEINNGSVFCVWWAS